MFGSLTLCCLGNEGKSFASRHNLHVADSSNSSGFWILIYNSLGLSLISKSNKPSKLLKKKKKEK